MMSLERLAEIERRDEDAGDLLQTAPFVVARRDRRELLTEVKRLRKLLAESLAEVQQAPVVIEHVSLPTSEEAEKFFTEIGYQEPAKNKRSAGDFAPMATQAYLDMNTAIAQSFADENDDS
jgi:hypothetical protein